MKRIVTTLALLAVCAAPALAANPVRISQIYGGGGGTNSAATYNVDYVELFNSSPSAVNIGGWAIQYGSATGNWASSAPNGFTFPVGTLIQPCAYVLVADGTGTSGGGPLPIAPDFTFSLGMSQSTGKVLLSTSLNSNVACGSEVGTVDKAAWGPTATCSETSPTAVTANNTGLVRNGGGLTDTDNNLSDFTIVTNPVPRNSQSAKNPNCSTVPTRTSTWGTVKAIYR